MSVARPAQLFRAAMQPRRSSSAPASWQPVPRLAKKETRWNDRRRGLTPPPCRSHGSREGAFERRAIGRLAVRREDEVDRQIKERLQLRGYLVAGLVFPAAHLDAE